MLISDVVRHGAQSAPTATALIFGDQRWSFAELWADVERMARRLSRFANPGETIAVVSENCPEMLIVAYAAPLASISVVFGNTRLRTDELATILEVAKPVYVFGSSDKTDVVTTLANDSSSARGSGTFDWLMQQPAEAQLPTPPAADAVAWMIHTSGTTGLAKTVLLTHRSLMAAVLNTALDRPMTADDTYLFCFPLFHVAAYNVLHAHLRRCAVVLVPKFDASIVANAISIHAVTTLSLAPTMVAMLLAYDEANGSPNSGTGAADLSSIHTIAYGASAMPTGLLTRASTRWGCGFAQGYGMTELSGNAVFLSPDDHRRALDSAPHLLASAGRPGPLAAVRIVDESGNDCDTGQAGEILIRGDQVAAGYLDRPDETASSFVGEWLHTGDLGTMDADGYLYVVDRLKDIVITGGENVSSREVEDVVSLHAQVDRVAVIGVPDDRWGEIVCAVVVPFVMPTDPAGLADELIAWTKTRLSGFKAPKKIVFSDDLPTNASGKIVKTELRTMLSGTLDNA